MAYQYNWSFLLVEGTVNSCYIIFQGCQWILYNCNVVTFLTQDIKHPFPTGTVSKSAMHQYNVFHALGKSCVYGKHADKKNCDQMKFFHNQNRVVAGKTNISA